MLMHEHESASGLLSECISKTKPKKKLKKYLFKKQVMDNKSIN